MSPTDHLLAFGLDLPVAYAKAAGGCCEMGKVADAGQSLSTEVIGGEGLEIFKFLQLGDRGAPTSMGRSCFCLLGQQWWADYVWGVQGILTSMPQPLPVICSSLGPPSPLSSWVPSRTQSNVEPEVGHCVVIAIFGAELILVIRLVFGLLLLLPPVRWEVSLELRSLFRSRGSRGLPRSSSPGK
jgi:hypothetical protein